MIILIVFVRRSAAKYKRAVPCRGGAPQQVLSRPKQSAAVILSLTDQFLTNDLGRIFQPGR